MKKSLKSSLATSLIASALYLPTTAYASGFALIETSASGMGQAFAGAAAVAEDPSTIYFNPAGMMYLEGSQLTLGVHVIDSNAHFEDKGSTDLTVYGVPQGNRGGNAGDTFFVPNFYYVRDFGDKYKIGLGINAPFGLGTEYEDSWMGRYTSTNSEVQSINFNPSIAFRANDKLSIGLGFNIQHMKAKLENKIYLGPGSPDAHSKIEGDNWEMGFNLGFIYELTPTTRLGVHYRSEISQTLEGDAEFRPQVAPILVNRKVHASLDTPSTFSISMTHQLNDRLTLLGDVTHTKWSNFEELKVVIDDLGVPLSTVDENWSDSYRVALGLKYQYSDRWILRTGIAHDETPIDDDYRTSRIPGDDRIWLSFGASYSPDDNLTIDIGYAHLWVDEAKIEEEFNIIPGDPKEGTLKGEFDADVDILSVQATWKF